jgi:hypothetical protein
MKLPETNYNGWLRPAIECKDGFKMSVQASSGHYCHPRKDGLPQYSEVEVGYPNRKEELLRPYQETDDDPTGCIYPYVPMHIIDEVVRIHGGLK